MHCPVIKADFFMAFTDQHNGGCLLYR